MADLSGQVHAKSMAENAIGPVGGAAKGSSELLGLPRDARVLIVNCDDFGMYHAINVAVVSSVEEGIARSCSLMVPCPWSQHAMHLLRQRPSIPFGIHLTLICETTRYAWGPVAEKEKVPSLLDSRGEFFTSAQIPQLLAQARPDEVEVEFRRQIDIVADAGLTPTHLDWHCLADGGRDEIFDLTAALAENYGLALRVWLEPGRLKMRRRGLPVIDNDFLDSFSLDGKASRYGELLRALPIGLNEWALHPGLGNSEARAIDPGWHVRRTDHEFLVSPRTRRILDEEQIVVTDYRAMQQLVKTARTGAVAPTPRPVGRARQDSNLRPSA